MNISQILTKLKSLVYSKSEADTLLSSKASSSHKHTKSEITDFPSLATVATSGSYNDLSNKPTIPIVNNATLTIQKNGTTVNSFTANASSNVTANITVPTKTSELTNNSGFLTSHQSLDGRVAKAGDSMTGTLKFSTENNVCLNLRPGNASYHDTISVQTEGNEAVVFATTNAVTSWLFINGEDSTTNHAQNRWQSLTPGLQIKSNKVAIGKLIANGANLTYPLEVNGTMSASSVVVTNNSSNGVLFGSYRVYVG